MDTTALCRNNLDSQKAAVTAGGAFGLGKAALWLTSRVSTVLFNSHLSEATEDGQRLNRVFGRVELGWRQIGENPFAGPGWFGINDTKRGCTVSYWDNEALARDLFLERETSDQDHPFSSLASTIRLGTPTSRLYFSGSRRLFAGVYAAIASGKFKATVELYRGRTAKLECGRPREAPARVCGPASWL